MHMIDIHSHILPDLDDGAKTLAESIEMARDAVKDGISVVIATPHHANGRYSNEALTITEAVVELNRALKEQRVPLEVFAGMEIRVYHNLLDDLDQNRILSLHDSRYMLIEFPSDRVPERMEEYIHELNVIGKIAIIAHPERNMQLLRNPDQLANLIRLGALSQITAGSISGAFGKRIKSFALELCKDNLVHFIASDAHNNTDRPFGLLHSYEQIAEQLNDDFVAYYQSNAINLLNNRPINAWEPIRHKSSFFSRLFKS